MTYPNTALTDACQLLMDDYGLTLDQIRNLAIDLPGECENRAEAAWLEHQAVLLELGGPDDSAYRRDMIAAGRSELLGGA